MRLKNKVAIVTGASSGIGRAIAEAFAKEGAKVVFSDINEADFELPEGSIFTKCDVSQVNEVKELVQTAVEKFGRLEVMVNNAGIATMGSILKADDQTWQKTIDVDLSGVFYGMREAAKIMKEKTVAGSIINITSIAGLVGFAGTVSYCASKGGVIQLTRSGALDLATHKIRVNAIAPGVIDTAMTKDFLADANFMKMVEISTPLGHVGEAEDIAQGAIYLASDESKYVTGQILAIDGGWTAK